MPQSKNRWLSLFSGIVAGHENYDIIKPTNSFCAGVIDFAFD